MEIDLEELAAIIELLDKSDFSQFRFEKGELRIEVSRGEALASAPVTAPSPTPATTPAPSATPSSAREPAPAPAATSEAIAVSLAADEFLVRSPMLGTFYSAPKPGEPPFVEVGNDVLADAVLCIVEVMKLMNSVTVGEAGTVRRVLVRDGDLVEFEQPLFVLGRSS